jgi:hypothetical protein
MLAKKWEKPCSEVWGCVNARESVAIVRATYLCVRGSRAPTGKIDNAGLGPFRPQTSNAPTLFPEHSPCKNQSMLLIV